MKTAANALEIEGIERIESALVWLWDVAVLQRIESDFNFPGGTAVLGACYV